MSVVLRPGLEPPVSTGEVWTQWRQFSNEAGLLNMIGTSVISGEAEKAETAQPGEVSWGTLPMYRNI